MNEIPLSLPERKLLYGLFISLVNMDKTNAIWPFFALKMKEKKIVFNQDEIALTEALVLKTISDVNTILSSPRDEAAKLRAETLKLILEGIQGKLKDGTKQRQTLDSSIHDPKEGFKGSGCASDHAERNAGGGAPRGSGEGNPGSAG